LTEIRRLNSFNCRNRSKSDDDLDDVQESEERRQKGLKLQYFYTWLAILITSGHESPVFSGYYLFMLQE
jgi:hypothetical protein